MADIYRLVLVQNGQDYLDIAKMDEHKSVWDGKPDHVTIEMRASNSNGDKYYDVFGLVDYAGDDSKTPVRFSQFYNYGNINANTIQKMFDGQNTTIKQEGENTIHERQMEAGSIPFYLEPLIEPSSYDPRSTYNQSLKHF